MSEVGLISRNVLGVTQLLIYAASGPRCDAAADLRGLQRHPGCVVRASYFWISDRFSDKLDGHSADFPPGAPPHLLLWIREFPGCVLEAAETGRARTVFHAGRVPVAEPRDDPTVPRYTKNVLFAGGFYVKQGEIVVWEGVREREGGHQHRRN